MLALLSDPDTWTALVKIAIINIVLSGDNAVVIALACRSLAPRQQRNAFIVGTAGIVVLMTASPSPMPSAASAMCIAEVAELTASAAGAPTKSRKSFSN